MTKNRPNISVVMPAYNAEKYIGIAIESILQQSYKNFELIIIDDHSTDKTSEVIKRYAAADARVVSVRNDQNMKISATLNRGLAMAKGTYIARMDADDQSMPTRLQKQYDFLESHPDAVIVGADINVCSETLQKINVRKYNQTDELIRRKIFRYGQFCHPVVMFRADVLPSTGGYNASLYDVEDYDLFFRLGKQGGMANIDEVLLNYRTSKTSVSALRARRQELLTLYVRAKACAEYGYQMGLSDKLYCTLQLVSVYFVPRRLKFWLFNFMRRSNG